MMPVTFRSLVQLKSYREVFTGRSESAAECPAETSNTQICLALIPVTAMTSAFPFPAIAMTFYQ